VRNVLHGPAGAGHDKARTDFYDAMHGVQLLQNTFNVNGVLGKLLTCGLKKNLSLDGM